MGAFEANSCKNRKFTVTYIQCHEVTDVDEGERG